MSLSWRRRLRLRMMLTMCPWLHPWQRNHLAHHLRNRLCAILATARDVADFAGEHNQPATDCAVDVLRREVEELERCMGRLGI